MKRIIFTVLLALAVVTPIVSGDTLRLKDGTKLEGRVIPQGDNYWVKLTSGSSKTVPVTDVAEWIRGDVNAAPGGASAAPSTRPAVSFAVTRAKANQADLPAAAVAVWKTFVDNNPASTDLPAAQQELAVWQKRVDESAERINGKWIGGDDRKAMIEKAGALFKEADHMMAANQTLQAMAKLDEAVKTYPNHFAANFWLGFLNLKAEKYDKAQANLENAIRIDPESAEAMSNLAIVLNFKKQYEKSVLMALKAATIKDSPEMALNLVNAIGYTPEEMRKSDVKLRPAVEASTLLSSKYRINKPGNWIYVGLTPAAPKSPPFVDKEGKRWLAMGNGTGFILSSDGLILTNKHVAEEGDMLLVRLADGTQKQAERVVIDDEQDLALIRIKSDKPLPFLQLAAHDEPGPGAECTALGFPLGNIMRLTLQVTPGSVSSVIDADTANIVVTCKVNPGNSGGPLVDKFGNVVGIVTQKTLSNTSVESYGKAISAGRIRDFLKKQAAKSKAELKNGDDGAASLNTEAIYKKVSPAAVCIIIMKSGDKPDSAKP